MADIIEIIKAHGGRDIKFYSLINNYGYTFTLNDVKADIRYWANCYGVALNYWRIHTIGDTKAGDIERAIFKDIEKDANATI